ncbi:MAG: DUF58 domain-containing protein [Spirochaetaceae bacterium]|nr:DUF58 domain-containing protein [Spirochaetaceae bacterium]
MIAYRAAMVARAAGEAALWGRRFAAAFPFTVKLRACGVYLFAGVLAYLAAAYLGEFFAVFATVFILLPLVSLTILLIAAAGLRYNQHFSNEQPVKGQELQYRCIIENGSALPLPRVRARFRAIRPATGGGGTESGDAGGDAGASRTTGRDGGGILTYLPGHQFVEREQTVQLPYRGIYTVGLDRIEIGDTLQLFNVRPRVRAREFRVYPRILPIGEFQPGTERRLGTSEVGSLGNLPDYSLFNQLREYRPGESVRHLAWKKFASTGIPVIKEYDSTSEPAVSIYVDLRPVPSSAEDVLLTEDVTVEALVALVNHFLKRNLPVTVRAASRTSYEFIGDHASDFGRFYESTFDLLFVSDISAARLYETHLETGMNTEVNSMFFITHLLDPELLILLDEQRSSNFQVTLIHNQTAEPAGRHAGYFNRLREQGTRVVALRGSTTITADLEAHDEAS